MFYQPARPTPDGRTLLALSPLEFLEAISRLIPPPRVHRHRYHGVLARNARLRPEVVALGRDAEASADHAPGQGTGALAPEESATALTGAAARSRWAQLLARIYEAFPLCCPECGADMRILAFLTDAGARGRHSPPSRPAPHRTAVSPARAPPQAALELNAEPVPELDPDQTRGA